MTDEKTDTIGIRYIVDDVDAAVDFYVQRLGFEERMRPGPGFALLQRGALRLMVNAPGAGGAGQAVDGDQPAPGGWNRFQVIVTDLPGEVAALQRAGAEFRGGIIEGRGGRQALVQDPAGNLVELFEPAG